MKKTPGIILSIDFEKAFVCKLELFIQNFEKKLI